MSKVKIKPEFCDYPEEAEMIFLITEDNGDRIVIVPEKWDYDIVPSQTVARDNVVFIE